MTAVAAEHGAATPADEASLLARARAGDQTAYGVLVRRHQSRLRLQLRRLTSGDAALADDLAQDAFVQAWQHRADFRGDARWSTWVYRIAYNLYLMHRRSPAGRMAAMTDSANPATHDGSDSHNHADAAQALAGAPTGDNTMQAAVPPDSHVAHQQHLQHARRLDVSRALARLDDAERLALIHCYWLDLSHQEAAEVLGLPLGTLKTQVARAKSRLRDWLTAWSPEHGS